MKSSKEPWLMNIKDKTPLPQNKIYCPAHRIPHTLPVFGEKITSEPCHIHKAKWRTAHHVTYCKLLKCPHYDRMIKFYNKSK